MSPDERMDALVQRVRTFDDCPHARLLAMAESLLTEAQWRELEALVARREKDRQRPHTAA